MREDFIILSVIGWCWGALVGLFLLIRRGKAPNAKSRLVESSVEARP